MHSRIRMMAALVPALALALVASSTSEGNAEPDMIEMNLAAVELDEAEVFIEFNSTDTDFGIQFFWDGEPWRRMRVKNPAGEHAMEVVASNNVREQGLTEAHFESAEPPASVLPMAQFLARFPEGEYEFIGKTLDRQFLEGEAELTHDLPAPPTNFSPPDGALVSAAAPLTLTFDAVTQDLNGAPLAPELYEVVLEVEDGDLLRILSVILDGSTANPAVSVPPQFLKPGLEYKFEVICQEESGNRTISETVFCTN